VTGLDPKLPFVLPGDFELSCPKLPFRGINNGSAFAIGLRRL
jgi:hypothetical protein